MEQVVTYMYYYGFEFETGNMKISMLYLACRHNETMDRLMPLFSYIQKRIISLSSKIYHMELHIGHRPARSLEPLFQISSQRAK